MFLVIFGCSTLLNTYLVFSLNNNFNVLKVAKVRKMWQSTKEYRIFT